MKQATSITDKIQNACKIARKDGVLFDSRLYCSDTDDNSEAVALENTDYKRVMSHLESHFTASVFVGSATLRYGKSKWYVLCEKFDDLKRFLGQYPDIVIRQKDAQMFFTLYGYDEQHEMELRRLSGEGRGPFYGGVRSLFTNKNMPFIRRDTTIFGEIVPLVD